MNKKEIGERIKIKMKEIDIGPSELARKMEVSNDTVFRWLRGDTLPHESRLSKLLIMFDTTPNYLLLGEETTQNVLVQSDLVEWLKDRKTIIELTNKIEDLNKKNNDLNMELKDYKDIIAYAKKNCTVKTCPILQKIA